MNDQSKIPKILRHSPRFGLPRNSFRGPESPARLPFEKILLTLFCSATLILGASIPGPRVSAAPSGESESPSTTNGDRSRPIDLRPCHVKGYSEQILCGSFDVAENSADPTGRKIVLDLAVVPAKSPQPEPDPVFVLAGGPGQGATSLVYLIETAFREIHTSRDLVFVDQRGTGDSNALECDLGDGVELFAQSELPTEILRLCRDELSTRADLRYYTTFHAMPDLDLVRQALGYERINLVGGSYGTRAALVYQSLFPERTRALILDGSAPFEIRLPLHYARDAQRAMDLLFDACAQDEACASAFPDPRGELEAYLQELDEEPVSLTLRHPSDGRLLDLELTRDAVTSTLRTILYQTPMASLIPLFISEMAAGHPEPMIALGLVSTRGAAESMSIGLTLSVLCTEDLPRIRDDEIERAVAGSFLGRSAIDGWLAACEGWPLAELPAGFDQIAPSSIPSLLLSGEADPATPPEWAESLRSTLTESHHVIVPGTGHNVFHLGCMPRLMSEFLDRVGSTAEAGSPFDGFDTSCAQTIERPPFVIDFSGPLP